jgi:hypothetical protein
MSNCNEYSLRPVDGEWAVRFNDDVISLCAERASAERLTRDLAQHLADLIRQPVRLVLAQGAEAVAEIVEPGALASVFGARESHAQALH